jgi:hypothetical protein
MLSEDVKRTVISSRVVCGNGHVVIDNTADKQQV